MESLILSKNLVRDSFAKALSTALLARYKKIPSAAFIAKEFNLRAQFTGTISSESVRRWLRGLAVPELEKLIVLRNWLDIDLNTLGNTLQPTASVDIATRGEGIVGQEEFIKTSQLVKASLAALMHDIAQLERNLTQKK